MSGAGGYNPQYFAPLFEVEDGHFWFRARNEVLRAIVRREISALAPGYHVLEVGCGTGYVLRLLDELCAGGTVVGMDLFHEGLRLARQRTRAPLVQARVESPPFRSRFELVGIFDTLEHVEDDRAALRHLRDLLQPGGALLVTVPAYQALWSEFDDEAHHCRRYEPATLETRLLEAGFTVEYLTPFMATLYPVARIGRAASDVLRRRRRAAGRAGGSAVVEQLRIMPIVNPLLSFLLTQEARLLAGRHRLPFGTSLLALARMP